jgi:hypothetical protein
MGGEAAYCRLGGEQMRAQDSCRSQSRAALACRDATKHRRCPLRPWVAWLIVGLLCARSVALCRAGDVRDYLTSDGQLHQRLVLEDAQGGVAGFTGTAWIIEPSGQWRVVPVHNRPLDQPRRQGQLTDTQLAALAHHLAAQDFLTLPRQLGGPPPVNPRQFTIRFGDTATTMVWKPLADLSQAVPPPQEPQAAAWARFIALVLVIQHWTKGELADGKEQNP